MMAPVGIIFLLNILWSSCVFSFGEDIFTISRLQSTSYDLFEVPYSKCSSCSSYPGATSHDLVNCKCACKYESATFRYDTSTWKCQSNTEVRREAGCTFYLNGESRTNPMEVLSERSSFKVVLPSLSCFIEYSSSKYLECEKWKRLDTLVDSPGPFGQHPLVETLQGKKIYTITMKDASVLKGMLISLRFKCSRKTSCVLFKIAGDIHCPVNTTQTLSTPQSTAVFTTSGTTVRTSTSSVFIPETKPPSTTHSGLPVTSVPSSQSTKSPGPGKGKPQSSSNDSSTGIIAAVAVVVIFVIIIAVVFGYIFWKKRRGENVWLLDKLQSIVSKNRSSPSSSSKRRKEDEPEESIYAEIPERLPNVSIVDRRVNGPTSEVYSVAYEDPKSAYSKSIETDEGSLYEEAGSVIQGRLSIHDDQDYVLPVDSSCLPHRKRPVVKNEQETLNELEYDVLENPNEETNSMTRNTAAGPESRYTPRRRPPSPPRRNNVPIHAELGTVNKASNLNDTDTYEDLQDKERPCSFYQSLDHNTLSKSR